MCIRDRIYIKDCWWEIVWRGPISKYIVCNYLIWKIPKGKCWVITVSRDYDIVRDNCWGDVISKNPSDFITTYMAGISISNRQVLNNIVNTIEIESVIAVDSTCSLRMIKIYSIFAVID